MEALNRAIEDEEEALREYLEAQEKHRLAEQRKVIVSEFVGRRYLDEPDLDSKLQQENEVAEREMAAAFRKMTGLQEDADRRIQRLRFLRSLKAKVTD
ncbi:MAG TPA: hypothetical protein VEQ37_11620 [Actinomycetota bacterium]|nr:hypothetical protein [Actinomycetota bacterium]